MKVTKSIYCYIAYMLTALMSTVGMMESSNTKCSYHIRTLCYADHAAEVILNSNARLVAKPMMQSHPNIDNACSC